MPAEETLKHYEDLGHDHVGQGFGRKDVGGSVLGPTAKSNKAEIDALAKRVMALESKAAVPATVAAPKAPPLPEVKK